MLISPVYSTRGICIQLRFLKQKSEQFLKLNFTKGINGHNMRLDKYLKVSRIIKRRTVANEVCDAKHVTVNGKIARASYEVKEGDLIEIQMGSNLTKYKVISINEYAKKDDAAAMYEVVS